MPVWSKVTAGIAAEPTSGGARAQLSPWRAGAGANTAGRLGADEVVPIEHRNGLSGTRLEPREVLRGVACVNGLRGSGSLYILGHASSSRFFVIFKSGAA